MKEMKDSAPGPDGIPYSVHYKHWEKEGPLILNSWKYNIEKNEFSKEQQLSTRMLLEKKAKAQDRSLIKWKVTPLIRGGRKCISFMAHYKVLLDFLALLTPLFHSLSPSLPPSLKNYWPVCKHEAVGRGIATIFLGCLSRELFLKW